MTATETLDILNVNSYKLDIDRIRNFNFMVKSVDLPSVTLPPVPIGTRFQKMNVASDQCGYSTLSVQIMIDENLYNYQMILTWMETLGFPEDFEQFKSMLINGETEKSKKSYTVRETSDLTLHLLTNHRNANRIIKFNDAFPISLSGISLNNMNTESEPIVATVEFEFTGMQFLV